MLRKNRQTGKLERLQSDGSWQEVSGDANASVAVAQPVPESTVDWSALSDLFKDDGGTDAGPLDSSVPVAGDLDTAGDDAGVLAAGVAPETLGADGAGAALAGGPGAGPDGLALPDEIPGLVSGDGRGTGGQRSVLDKLRGKSGRMPRPGKKIEVGARAAVPRGPAVRDGTQHRLESRARAKSGEGVRFVPKPAPKSLAESPKWMRDLFEAHFRSSRTLELRRSMNRMKLSRQDYAIGWMVAIEAARADPAILHVRGGGAVSANGENE